MKNRVFVDTETTGLRADYHEIIEIYIIKEDARGKHIGEWHYKIAPEFIDRASEKALEINGYTPKKWRDAKSFNLVCHEIKEIVQGCIWIGHNPRFDYDFFQEAFFRAGVPGIRCTLIDTKVLAYEHLIGLKSLSFDNIRRYLGWTSKNAHTAETDTKQLRRFFNLTYRMSPYCRVYLYITFLLFRKNE